MFRFRQLIGERVKIAFEEEKVIQGKIIFVGNDFIEVVANVKKEKHKHEFKKREKRKHEFKKREKHKHEFKKKVFLVQFDQIKWVERLDIFC
ncbi:hypothetical protein M3221_22870 [Domibacillus indicus]|uniref:hypothetical protein n=1 Tax=Domibacillus indicus TaxID=1437523 RepID=UPI0020404DB5|nr:hypothetical protein [Domibacillus indicus]MCM3791182.1 hypothetical protein [Domibacillus indicus]